MQDPYLHLATLLLPKGLLEFFDLKQVVQQESGLEIHLEEKNLIPEEYQDQKLESKGLLPEVSIQDFPIRGQKVPCASNVGNGKSFQPERSLQRTGI